MAARRLGRVPAAPLGDDLEELPFAADGQLSLGMGPAPEAGAPRELAEAPARSSGVPVRSRSASPRSAMIDMPLPPLILTTRHAPGLGAATGWARKVRMPYPFWAWVTG